MKIERKNFDDVNLKIYTKFCPRQNLYNGETKKNNINILFEDHHHS